VAADDGLLRVALAPVGSFSRSRMRSTRSTSARRSSRPPGRALGLASSLVDGVDGVVLVLVVLDELRR
jgi:hypothetical protein